MIEIYLALWMSLHWRYFEGSGAWAFYLWRFQGSCWDLGSVEASTPRHVPHDFGPGISAILSVAECLSPAAA